MKYLILSPFAENGLKNSGDDLIICSLTKLLKYKHDIISIAKSTEDKDKTFEKCNMGKYEYLICPAFRWTIGENEEILETRLKYIEKAIRYNIPVYIIGSSWCIYPGIKEQTSFKINSRERNIFEMLIQDKRNYISVRDVLTQKLLFNNFKVEVPMTGDLGLFDLRMIGKGINIKTPFNIAVSLPHNVRHYEDTFHLAAKLKTTLKCEVFITSHQKETKDLKFGNIEYINLSGRADKLEWYNNVTFHVGFRLHAHIWFLRNRKPSLLIAEDGRGFGNLLSFSNLGMHSAPSYIMEMAKKYKYESQVLKNIGMNASINIEKIVNKVQNEISFGYYETIVGLNYIDNVWKDNLWRGNKNGIS